MVIKKHYKKSNHAKNLKDCQLIIGKENNNCVDAIPIVFQDYDPNDPLSTTSTEYQITKPGCYKLQYDVRFNPPPLPNPTDGFGAAIRVLVDGVTINLSGFTLESVNDNPWIGIAIGELLFSEASLTEIRNDVTILNGTISNFTTNGFLAENATGSDIPWKNFKLIDLNVLDCGLSTNGFGTDGISFSNPFFPPYEFSFFKNVQIIRCNVLRAKPNPLIVEAIDGLLIDQCKFNDGFTDGSFIEIFPPGIMYSSGTKNGIVKNSQFNGYTALGSDFEAFLGIETSDGTNLKFSHCEMNNYTIEDAGFGALFFFDPFLCNGVNVEHFTSNNLLVKKADPDFFFSVGFGGLESKNISYSHINIDNWSSISVGVFTCTECENYSINDVNVNNVGGDEAVSILGFLMASFFENPNRNIQVSNCNFSNLTASLGSSYGIKAHSIIGADIRNIKIRNLKGDVGIGVNIYSVSPNFEDDETRDITLGCIDIKNLKGNVSSGIMINTLGLGSTIPKPVKNILIEHCKVKDVYSTSDLENVAEAGIYVGTQIGLEDNGIPYSGVSGPVEDVTVRCCKVENVRNAIPVERSAGIIFEGVKNPKLYKCTISGCDRGVLFGKATPEEDFSTNGEVWDIKACDNKLGDLSINGIDLGSKLCIGNIPNATMKAKGYKVSSVTNTRNKSAKGVNNNLKKARNLYKQKGRTEHVNRNRYVFKKQRNR